MSSNIVARLRNQRYNATIEEIYADSMEAANEIERLEKEMTELATGNIERWERECAMANRIERLREAVEDALPCLHEHDPEVEAICRAVLENDDD